jgi:hypothetical protein
MTRLTYGADPELLLTVAPTPRARKRVPFPVCGKLGGTKAKPRMVGDYGVQEDNVMAEYTIPVSEVPRRMFAHVRAGHDRVLSELNRDPEAPRVYPHPECSLLFPEQILTAAGSQAMQFGCSPDFDAYDMGAPAAVVDPRALTTPAGAWRFAGGHIHFGYYEKYPDVPPFVMALLMDLFVGVQLASYERQGERRKYYGQPGRYRPTPYGIEYPPTPAGAAPGPLS